MDSSGQLGGARSNDSYTKTRLASDTLVIVVSPDHPWASVDKLERHHLESENFIVYGNKSATYKLVEDHFSKEGVRLRPPLALGNVEGIKEMARLGLGAGIVAQWIVRKELAEGILVKKTIGKIPPKRRWTAFTSRGKSLSLAEETFIAACKDTLRTVLKAK